MKEHNVSRNAADDALFENAVAAHSRRLVGIARSVIGNDGRAAAEDVVQTALMNLYQHRDRYDWNNAGPLLRRAVVNEALRVLRQPRMSLVSDDQPAEALSPADALSGREQIERVRAAIASLPEHFRAAIVLCEYERMSYADIADALGASVPQIKTWLHRGRRQLAKILVEPADAPERTCTCEQHQ